MPNPPSDDDTYIYRRQDGNNGTAYFCPTTSARVALTILQAHPDVAAAAFVTALTNALAS